MGIVINGDPRQNFRWFAGHLTNEENNERITKFEAHNTVATDVHGFFEELNFIAKRMNPEPWDFFYHANINTESDERLTDKQWDHAILRLGQELKDKKGRCLADQPYIVHEHEKKGRIHRHIIWSRMHYDKDTGKFSVIDIQFNYYKHLDIARELEREFGLRINIDPRKNPKRERSLANWEFFRGHKSGIDPRQVKKETTEVFNKSLSGEDFIRKMEALRYVIAKGDRRDYVIIDIAGDVHSIAKRVKGANASIIREKMKDVDRSTLPTVGEAKKLQERERMRYGAVKEQHRKIDEQRVILAEDERLKEENIDKDTLLEIRSNIEARRGAIPESDQIARQQLDERLSNIDERIRHMEEPSRLYEKQVSAAEDFQKTEQDIAQRQLDISNRQTSLGSQQVILETDKTVLQAHQNMVLGYKESLAKQHAERDVFIATNEQTQHQTSHAVADDTTIKSAHQRYMENLPHAYRPDNVSGYMIDAATNEYKAFQREEADLNDKITKEQDPTKREKLVLQRDIQRKEYCAQVEERLGAISEVTRGRMVERDKDGQRDLAKHFDADGKPLHFDKDGNPRNAGEFSPEYQKEYSSCFDAQGNAKTIEAEKHYYKAEKLRAEAKELRQQHLGISHAHKTEKQEPVKEEKPVLLVETRDDRGKGSDQEPLKDYLERVDGWTAKNEDSREAWEYHRTKCLNSMSEDLKEGRNIDKYDISGLSKEDIQGLRESQNPDEHLQEIVSEHDRQQTQQKEHDRTHSLQL